MKASTHHLLLIVPTALAFFISGCQTADHHIPTASGPPIELFSNHPTVAIRIPDEGRYPPVLFWKPTYIPKGEVPDSWTGKWLDDEAALSLMYYSHGAMVIPTVVAAGIHSLVGSTVYRAKHEFQTGSTHSEHMRRINALTAAARPGQFEHDLKHRITGVLQSRQISVVAGSPSPPTDAELDIDLIIERAGMVGQRPQTKSQNPTQSFELVIRANITRRNGETDTRHLIYQSVPNRYREWAANDAKRFATIRQSAIESVALQLSRQISVRPAGNALLAETTSR